MPSGITPYSSMVLLFARLGVEPVTSRNPKVRRAEMGMGFLIALNLSKVVICTPLGTVIKEGNESRLLMSSIDH